MVTMFGGSGCILILILFVPSIESARPLNEYIRNYEPLSYSTDDLHRNHLRAKRSVTRNNAVTLKFLAYGRDFHIRLKRDLTTFSSNLVILGPSGEEEDLETSHIYEGHILGESGSHVFGSISDGVFHGKIMSPRGGSWYVEKAHHYFPPHQINATHHSVIYHEDDVRDPYANVREGHSSGCGVTEDRVQWMDAVQNSGEPDTPPTESKLLNGPIIKVKPWNGNDEQPGHKYIRQANKPEPSRSRTKRARKPMQGNKNTCSLYIQTDPLIWRHISDWVNNDAERTKEEILSLISQHVSAVNSMYRGTRFDGRMEHRNIMFEVQRIKIDDNTACHTPLHYGDANPFCMENINVSNFLNLHSHENHEDFCLAYVFTYRDFTGGTLGLAWQASASGTPGGICEKYKTYTKNDVNSQFTKRSLNTGIITFSNYNSRVPPQVSQLTLAHQIGHNFGSPHDFPPECRPGGPNGNYIMFASATSGDRPNNSKFSSCSIGNISNVLDAMAENREKNCFTVSEGAFCGNNVVEAGEECDCGYDDNECEDRCCYPRLVSEYDKMRNHTAKGCQRRYNTQCSPSQGPCCSSDTCHFVPKSGNSVCKQSTECSLHSVCSGTASECPPPVANQDKTRCNNDTQLCIDGECRGSTCLEWNLVECFLTSNTIQNIDKRQLCELACQNDTDVTTCRSTSEFAQSVGLKEGGISLRPGSPCDNFEGYCDDSLECRAVDTEGPMARSKNLVFGKKTSQTSWQWIITNLPAWIQPFGTFIASAAQNVSESVYRSLSLKE